jgi:tetratricopeptide (TPR) repeat protein
LVLCLAGPARAAAPMGTPYTNSLIPHSAGHFDFASRCKDETRKPEERIEYCRQMIGAGSGRRVDAMIEGEIGVIYIHAGQYDLAIQAFDQSLKWVSDDPATLNNRCFVRAIANKDLDAARADCDAALALAQYRPSVLDSRGFVQFRQGRFADAASDYSEALKLDAKLAPSLFMRGVCEHRLGKTAEGNADIAAAEALDAKVAQRYAGYGVAP